ncbi:MAG: Ldh family oxidoreductase [Cytophagales bacterium]|nr:MAG: Ldh family oxidoreductase [Cytophagales bacterium]
MISIERLFSFCKGVFVKMGFSEEKAQKAAHVLLSADKRGIDSHGVARLSGYVKQWDMGKLQSQSQSQIIHQTPSTATLDGQAGLGLVIAQEAMEIAIKKAQQVGTGWVAVQNSGHFGIAGYHAMLALPHDMIGIVTTHASGLVAPTFSLEKLLGTNPFAVAIPALEEPPFVADFATTAVAYGKLQILQRKNEQALEGWMQDANANPTTNPHAPKEGGALLPLGSTRLHGSHKGYALGAIADILSGVLSGANYGPWVPPFATAGSTSERTPPVGKGTGHFLGAMRIDAFREADEFKRAMDHWIRTFRSAKAIEGEQVLIPGDPERILEEKRLLEGAPIHKAVMTDLEQLAQRFEIPL